MKYIIRLCSYGLLLLLPALAMVVAKDTPAPTIPANHLPVPFVRQATEWSCGAASTVAVLMYWNLYSDTESALWPELGTTEDGGTDPLRMVSFIRSKGLTVEMKERSTISDLRKAIAAGITPILDIQAYRTDTSVPWEDTWENGHYIVAVALDSHYLYAMDPSEGFAYVYIPLSELPKRWHDYEDDGPTLKRYYQLALFVEGKDPVRQYPGKVIRLE